MKVVVLGSNSFSGSDFIDLLLDDPENEVCGISRSPEKSSVFLPYKKRQKPRLTFHQLDLNEHSQKIIELLDQFKPHYIVNFAAQSEVAPSWENPEQWFQTNAVALANIIKSLNKRNYLKKYIHISSPEVYGSCSGNVLETAPLNPSTPYAASKAAADLLLFTYFKNFEFPLVTIRSTNVYGAHQQLFKIIPRSVIYLKSDKKIMLHGGGKAVKSYIHIRDISRGELYAMLHGKPGEIYHLSPEQGVAVCDVVELICKRMNADFDATTTKVEERLGQDAAYLVDSTKSRRELGWQPQISLEQGINDVVSWVDTNWDTIKQLPLDYIHRP